MGKRFSQISIFFDGGIHKKRVAIVDVRKGEYRIKVFEELEARTSNELELLGLLKSLEYAYSEYGSTAKNIVFYGDSRLVIRHIGDNKPFSAKNLRRFERICRKQLMKFKNPIKLIWIPRKKNLAGLVLELLYKKRKTFLIKNV